MTELNPMTPLVLLMLVALPLPLGAIVTAAASTNTDPGELTLGNDSTSTPFYWWSNWHAPALLVEFRRTGAASRDRSRPRRADLRADRRRAWAGPNAGAA